ncbi:MAG: transcriptional regulator [Moraxellaceae bacterium]|jgi:AcrR family transcriptional regulator|nr:transcriptional regulator [Moraxellaceae bacterium]
MRDKLLSALREAARLSAPRPPTAAAVAAVAGVDEAEVRAHLGPPENFSALLSYQAPVQPSSPAQETRERIIASAARVFAHKGFQRASLDEVAADAGMTKGAIYWHFKSKNDLFFAMLDSRLRQDTAPLLGDLHTLIRDGGDPLAALTGMFATSLERCTSDPEWPRLYLECLSLARDPDVRDRLSAFYDEVWALSRGFTEQLQAHGLTAEDIDPQVAAIFWTALFDGLVVAWLIKGEALELSRLLPTLFRMLWRGLAPATASPNDKNSSGDAT